MIHRTITAKTQLSPAELADEICSLSAEQLAEFFDLVARRTELWGHGGLDAHLYEGLAFFTPETTKRFLRKLGQYGE